jgi:TonB-dependent receptor
MRVPNVLRASLVFTLVSVPTLFPYKAFGQVDEVVPVDEKPAPKPPTSASPPSAPAPPAPATPPVPSPSQPPVPSTPAQPSKPSKGANSKGGDEGDPARPPPRGKAVIWGVITDARANEPIAEAEVSYVRRKKKKSVLTDLDGRYRLELDPGTYDIRFWAEVHQAQVVQRVTVELGTVARLDADLAPDESAVDVIEVETTAERQAVEGQIIMRQKATSVGDSVGRADIAKTPDRNAAQSAQRVVGATIVGSRFVYVRGLGQRYTNAQLNGVPLPSPEPDVNAVPLDLFPSLILDSLTIAKSFTPESPGDFAGGSVRITTREIPKKFLFSPSLSVGYNTESTFRNRLAYRGSSTDWLGFDDGLRALPSGIPSYRLSRNASKPDGSLVNEAELKQHGEAINTYMSARRRFTGPNFGGSVVIGDGFELGEGRRIGYLAALTYSRTFTIRDEIYREYRKNGADLARNVDYDIETGNDAVRWGAFASATYELAQGHRIVLTGLRSQLSDNAARWTDGRSFVGEEVNRHQTRLSFISRELTSAQLQGEHTLKALGRASVDWNLSISRAARHEPNTRDDVWDVDAEASLRQFRYAGNNAQAGRHLFSDQGETAYGAGLDWSQPIVDAPRDSKLKFGGAASLRNREFAARRFNFQFARSPALTPPVLCPHPQYDESCADALFQNANIGPIIELDESTLPTDAYHAKLNVYSTYFMGDISLAENLRAIVGERIEVTRQTIDPFDQFNSGAKITGADLKSTDLLPAVSLVLSTSEKTKLRGSFTRTVARPQLRELAPYAYNEIVGGRTLTGNPNLKLTKITNADLRFEYFPSAREVLAASLFAKHFVDPIEPVILQTGGANTLTFENSPSADLIGLELEARKSLDFITEPLKPLSLIANLTLARSKITVRQTGASFITNTSRSLTNQAPYVINLALDYAGEGGLNARLLYNVVGPSVVEVGTGGLDDSYEQPRHRIDAAVSKELGKHFTVRLTGENLLNAPFLVTVGSTASDDRIVRKYRDGMTFVLSAQYSY